MIRKRNLFYIALILIVVLIYRFFDDNKVVPLVNLKESPVYQSGDSLSYFYNPTGKLDYLIIARDVQHYAFDNRSTFLDPVITFYNTDKKPSWRIQSEEANLLNNKLFLYENVKIDSLLADSKLKKIITTNVTIGLGTKIATSNDYVTIYGDSLKSTGIGVIASLPNKTADILRDVQSSFFRQPAPSIEEIKK